MIIEAVYCGQEKLGYIPNGLYKLNLSCLYTQTIVKREKDKSGSLTYNTVLGFLKEWDNIRIISK